MRIEYIVDTKKGKQIDEYYYLINMKKTLGKYEVAKDDIFEFYYGDA